jgi:DNA invertase Pin-like site-specific DNA recombinase
VAYYRVNDSVDLEEQIECVKQHVNDVEGELVRIYRDDDAIKRSDRPELAKALRYTKREGGSLIVATLRGLSRDVAFLRALRDSGVDFFACDLPHANTSTIHVLTALAEYDARAASERSKKAAAAYKSNGGRLGAARPQGRNLDDKARRKGAKMAGKLARERADLAYRELAPRIKTLRNGGSTLQEIADLLNSEGARTRLDRPWNAMQVSRVLKRPLARRGTAVD